MAEGTQVRCDHAMHGIITEGGLLEVKCRSHFCGGPGIVVLHYFSVRTGVLVETKKFADPAKHIKERTSK